MYGALQHDRGRNMPNSRSRDERVELNLLGSHSNHRLHITTLRLTHETQLPAAMSWDFTADDLRKEIKDLKEKLAVQGTPADGTYVR